MADKTPPGKTAQKTQDRDARLKAALKANMARRKAQARARTAGNEADKGPEGPRKDGS